MTNPAFPEIAIAVRTLVALVYLTGALGKMRHWAVFQGVVANYRLLPEFLVAPIAYSLPPVEALIGAMLVLEWAPPLGSTSPWPEVAAAALLSLFAFAMAVNLLRGRRNIDCGCFQSALKQTLSWKLVTRNVVMVLLLGFAIGSNGGAGDWRETFEGLLVGGVLFVILQSLTILWSITPAWRDARRPDSGAAR